MKEIWYAMKVIKKEVILERGYLEHAITEKRILEYSNHPYLVALEYCF